MRRATAILTFVLLVVPVSAAGADGTGRCYPPPCTVEAPAPSAAHVLSGLSEVSPVGSLSSGEDVRSPAPFVAAGLLAVFGSLTVVALRRRTHIVRRSGAPLRIPPVSPPVGAPGSHEPQPALR